MGLLLPRLASQGRIKGRMHRLETRHLNPAHKGFVKGALEYWGTLLDFQQLDFPCSPFFLTRGRISKND